LMIGRAAQGNPWIFREILHFLSSGESLSPPAPSEVLDVMERHLAALRAAYGPEHGVLVARKHIGWYLAGRPNALETRKLLMRAASADEQVRLLRAYFGELEAGSDDISKASRLAA